MEVLNKQQKEEIDRMKDICECKLDLCSFFNKFMLFSMNLLKYINFITQVFLILLSL